MSFLEWVSTTDHLLIFLAIVWFVGAVICEIIKTWKGKEE